MTPDDGVPKHGRAVSRSTQLGVLARPLSRTSSGSGLVCCESRCFLQCSPVAPREEGVVWGEAQT